MYINIYLYVVHKFLSRWKKIRQIFTKFAGTSWCISVLRNGLYMTYNIHLRGTKKKVESNFPDS